MTDAEREALIEAVATAHRARDPRGEIRFHPAWHDLDPEGRSEAADKTLIARKLEAVLDPQGLSTTAHSVLAQIRAAR